MPLHITKIDRIRNGFASPSPDVNEALHRWIVEQWGVSEIESLLLDGRGYVQFAHMLASYEQAQWSLQALRKAALSIKPYYEHILIPGTDGISIPVKETVKFGDPEYWVLRQEGSCYSSALLLENYEVPSFSSSLGHPAKTLWFDVAISRIAKSLVDSASIYKDLGVDKNEQYLFAVIHGGLRERTLYTSNLDYFYYATRRPVCKEDVHEKTIEVTQKRVGGELVELTHQIAFPLFSLFEFVELSKEVVAGVLERNRIL